MAQRNEALQELVDNPNEVLSVEYKAWLDLAGDTEACANLARHIAAIANHGGGFIVFGFNNKDLSYAGPNPYIATAIDRDRISGLVKRYLDPTFQCDVQVIRSQAGSDHPVIVVPGHGAVPICAKAGGPQIDGKVRGIVAGTYYTRKAGPESHPIRTPAEWAPIIRRCALHERAAILGALGAVLSGAPTAADGDLLKVWHEAAHAAFLRDVELFYRPDAASRYAWPELDKWHYQLSYRVEYAGGQGLQPEQTLEALREIIHEVPYDADVGSLFYPHTRAGISPRFTVDEWA